MSSDPVATSSGTPLSVSLLGHQASGKTTFVAALWARICDDDPLDDNSNELAVRLNGALPEGTAYLDEARFQLLGGRPVPRTATDTGEDVLLNMLIGGEAADLHVLDLSGESLERLFLERSCPRPLADQLASANCLMLFVHPHEIRLPATIAEANRLAGDSADQPTTEASASLNRRSVEADPNRNHVGRPPGSEALESDAAASAPTSVQLVDLMQIASEMAGASAAKPVFVSVVVSAWDVIDAVAVESLEPRVDPREWLSRMLPLLAQFLEVNRQVLPSRVFGVSAQGGNYDDEDTANRLARLTVAQRAVVVEEGPTAVRDIAAPLRWLLGQRTQ